MTKKLQQCPHAKDIPIKNKSAMLNEEIATVFSSYIQWLMYSTND